MFCRNSLKENIFLAAKRSSTSALVSPSVRLWSKLNFSLFGQLMTTYDNLWQLMTAYDNLCQLMTTYNSLWQLMTTYDNLWQLMTAYDNFWQLLTTFDNFWQLLTTYDNLWQLMTTFANFWQLMTTFNNFWQLLTTFDNFWQLLTTIDNYSIDNYWQLLTTARKRRHRFACCNAATSPPVLCRQPDRSTLKTTMTMNSNTRQVTNENDTTWYIYICILSILQSTVTQYNIVFTTSSFLELSS